MKIIFGLILTAGLLFAFQNFVKSKGLNSLDDIELVIEKHQAEAMDVHFDGNIEELCSRLGGRISYGDEGIVCNYSNGIKVLHNSDGDFASIDSSKKR